MASKSKRSVAAVAQVDDEKELVTLDLDSEMVAYFRSRSRSRYWKLIINELLVHDVGAAQGEQGTITAWRRRRY